MTTEANIIQRVPSIALGLTVQIYRLPLGVQYRLLLGGTVVGAWDVADLLVVNYSDEVLQRHAEAFVAEKLRGLFA